MPSNEKCPKCGADPWGDPEDKVWVCASMGECEGHNESRDCLRTQLAAAKAENERLNTAYLEMRLEKATVATLYEDSRKDLGRIKSESTALKAALTAGQYTDCPDCGPMVNVDEDGCCVYCGADAMMYGRRADYESPEVIAPKAQLAAARECINRKHTFSTERSLTNVVALLDLAINTHKDMAAILSTAPEALAVVERPVCLKCNEIDPASVCTAGEWRHINDTKKPCMGVVVDSTVVVLPRNGGELA